MEEPHTPSVASKMFSITTTVSAASELARKGMLSLKLAAQDRAIYLAGPRQGWGVDFVEYRGELVGI